MHNDPKAMRPRHRGPRMPRPVSKAIIARPTHSQSAHRNYERYLALARAEAQAGNPVGAENYYQHAEHFFRLMSAARENANEGPIGLVGTGDR